MGFLPYACLSSMPAPLSPTVVEKMSFIPGDTDLDVQYEFDLMASACPML